MSVNMMKVFSTYLLGFFVIYAEASTTIILPAAGNCGNKTVLTCQVTGTIGSTGWYGLGRSLVINGTPVRPEDNNKYTETRGTSSFTLTIYNTDITDEGEYLCRNEFDTSQLKRLNIECKASVADLSVTNGKKVSITVDKLYPSPPAFRFSLKKENTDVAITGSRTCSSSTQYSGYYRCIWSSSSSLANGSYTYSIVVTTITEADPLTGSFNIVPPKSPVILNTTVLDDNRIVLYGNEGLLLTIQCISSGGYPIPTVAWYKESVSTSNQLASTTSGTLQNDGTYTVTLSHTFTPIVSDDEKTLICRSYYPQADSAYRESEITSVMLYLRLKPSQPTVTQVSNVSSGGTVEVRCTTTGSRPAATITWSYQGSTFSGQDSNNIDIATETYTVVSVFRRRVTAADNRHEVQCVVTHPTLTSPSERTASVKLNVQFQASTTVITGNKVMTATGTATLTLTCTTGSSNPASDITWKNGSTPLYSDRPYTNTTGENNGVVRSQQLVLTPTRYMDGDVVTCSVSNLLSQSQVTDTATLDLRCTSTHKPDDRPIIEQMPNIVEAEGNKVTLVCSASSNPASTFKWYKQGQNAYIHQGNETHDSNQLAYTIQSVRRKDAGIYRCNANNGIETADEKIVSVTVLSPTVQSFYVEGQSNVTVEEHHAKIEFTCAVDKNTTTDIKIIFEGEVLQKKVDASSLSFIRQDVSCYDAGVYTCEGSNINDRKSSRNVTLFVKCSPRPRRQILRNITSNLYDRVTLSFTVIAYPEPGPKGFEWRKDNKEGWIPLLSNDDLKIASIGLQSNLTLLNVSNEDYGHYMVTVSNNIGSYEQHIFLSEKQGSRTTEKECKCTKSDNAGIIVGIALGVVCCFLATYATYVTVVNKRITNKETRQLRRLAKSTTYANTTFASEVTERQSYNEDTAVDNETSQQYTDLCRYANTEKDSYDVIEKYTK